MTLGEDYRHYSQRCLGIDIDDDTEDEEVLSESSQLVLNNSLPLFYQVGTGFDLENAVILEEIIRRRNVRYNAIEIIFQARVNTDELPDTLRKTPEICSSISSLTVERVVSVIMRVLQSKDKITLEDGFTVDVITILPDVGDGKTNTRAVNIDIDRIRRKSVITVPLSEDGVY
ncbi:hypothetical protein AVEN_137529-1 [Araneus ventricosus]|uniref:Uncharacterized protein n=1 Tax=Araneus ventricosus TaxID=182803 RepID=A0A4Y2JN07_ARAVE|nr:hypothetical protein AVEN_137529-1 [Araneus ventricosus]